MKFLRFLEHKLIQLAVYLITAYQKTMSPDHGPYHNPTCRFTPTCSEYTKKAILTYGLVGIIVGTWRIIRCNPIFTREFTHEDIPQKIKIFGIFELKPRKI
jgi:putative membrane protein insertion efficiency factor